MPETKKYLNRDGLKEYNSLLPHSSAEIQEYVNDWLDAHPEATTTVQDGSITTQKLADGSVTRNKLAADVAHLLGGMMVTGEVQGEILSADDAYSIAPLSMEIDGKSTQDGTPTPDAPAEIVSLEQVNLHFDGRNLLDYNYLYDTTPNRSNNYFYFYNIKLPAGTYTLSCNWCDVPSQAPYGFLIDDSSTPETTWRCYKGHPSTITVQEGQTAVIVRRYRSGNYIPTRALHDNGTIELQLSVSNTALPYQPYDGTSVLLNLTQALRSLPDGTKDTLALSYLRPSTRDGWAWYTPTLTKVTNETVFDESYNWSRDSGTEASDGTWRFECSIGIHGQPISTWSSANNAVPAYCDQLQSASTGAIYYDSLNRFGIYQYRFYVRISGITTLDELNAWLAEHPLTVLYPIAATTTTLDSIELPVLPAPECTVWSDPTTGLKMSYMRDANIVISDIEQAIADL